MNIKRFLPGPWSLIYIFGFLIIVFVVGFIYWVSKNPIVPSNPYKIYP